MIILEIIGWLYLIIGFIYATYILLFAWDAWYLFPINVIFGPITLVLNFISVLKEESNRKI